MDSRRVSMKREMTWHEAYVISRYSIIFNFFVTVNQFSLTWKHFPELQLNFCYGVFIDFLLECFLLVRKASIQSWIFVQQRQELL